MRLKLVELELKWPEEISLSELREWIVNQISDNHGKPLRWSITAVKAPEEDNLFSELSVEAVIILF